MEDFVALRPAERDLLDSLNQHGVRFLLVGLSAAVLQGANAGTRDIGSLPMDIDGVTVRVLPLERIIASKRASGRPKDVAALPALEEALAAVRGETPA